MFLQVYIGHFFLLSINILAGDDDDASCELTTGSVVCGNAARALKARQRGLNNQPVAANRMNKSFLSEVIELFFMF